MNPVYKPSDDTWLLLEALKSIGSFGRGVEVGSGSGIISLELTKHLKEVVATDVDWSAVTATKTMLRSSDRWSECHVVCCDCLSAFREGRVFELLVSNPPYLEPEGLDDRAVEGGGRFLERLLEDASKRLEKGGVMLLVVSSLTSRLDKILRMAEKLGFRVEVASRRRLFFEELMILQAEYR